MEIVIVADSCCDLPYAYVKENPIEIMPMNIIIEDQNKKDNFMITGEYSAFYQAIREGTMPKTSQINAYEFKEKFSQLIKAGKQVVYIGFSSALSGCINSAKIAVEEIKEEIPTAKIAIIDSKCASMGQGLLIYYAVQQIKQGKTFEEVVTFVEDNKLKINHWFTVSDLNYLFRGGRVSKTAATVGTLLQIKPIMHVDNEGRLTPVEKAKGRKKSLKVLIEKLKEKIIEPEKQIVFISHGDVLEEAEQVKEALLEECHVKEVWINYVGATVGSHSGPGTIAIFFMGEQR
ncbi:MAG: DegV family protein [Cellulosilyticum sp.]|nr:DegV family protein [Cellulosilyticum sp.]